MRMPSLVAQTADQLEELGLDRHVQRRRRLVGHDQRRMAAQRHGDHHPLALAARQLVRVALERSRRVRDYPHLLRATPRPDPPSPTPPPADGRSVIVGLSELVGSWNTASRPISRIRVRSAKSPDLSMIRSVPSTDSPLILGGRLACRRQQAQSAPAPNVVLPHPDSPTTATISPRPTRQVDAPDVVERAATCLVDHVRRSTLRFFNLRAGLATPELAARRGRVRATMTHRWSFDKSRSLPLASPPMFNSPASPDATATMPLMPLRATTTVLVFAIGT